MKRLFQVALVSLLVSQFFASRFENMAFADQNDQVSLCHSRSSDNTGSHTNPYGPQLITVDTASIFSQGHDSHDGPVWYAGITTGWGDIIPPFTWYECPDDEALYTSSDINFCSIEIGHGINAETMYTDPTSVNEYPGKNWVGSEEGQAFWNNDCQIPGEEEPTPTPTDDPEEPTPTPTDSPNDDPDPTPTDSPNNDPEPTPTDAPGTGGVILEPTPIVRGQVLGVSTMANTGVMEDFMALGSITSGIVLLASQYVQKKR